jgi:hypothetical protein
MAAMILMLKDLPPLLSDGILLQGFLKKRLPQALQKCTKFFSS